MIYFAIPLILLIIIICINASTEQKRLINRNNKIHKAKRDEVFKKVDYKGRVTEKDWADWYKDITNT